VRTGQDYRNKQTDALATFGGDVVRLPAGMAKFSVAYEHRDESVDFVPLQANQLGLTGSGTRTVPQSGEYNTDELSGEVLIPIVGGDFTLPFIRALEFNGAVRHVDNSIAGKETLWSLGARWEPLDGVTFRGSRSRNFRAPTLTQLFAPSSTTLASGGVDPCDADRISSGPNPTQRRASCLALFQANPLYGTGGVVGGASGNSAPIGSSAEARLAAFQNRAENFTIANITSGGNPNLRNEISKTWTYGVVVQPRFLRGLTIVADRIEVDLTDGLSPFTTADFAAACYDDANPDPAVCSAFQRLAVGDGTNAAGTTIAGTTTTFNAGVVRFRGEVFNVNYQFGLGRGLGRMEIGVEATHTGLLTTSVTGNTFTRTDNTALQPDWSGRLDVRYTTGPFRLTYQLNYLDKVLSAANATIENTPTPVLDRNIRHDIGGQYDFGTFQIRAGVNNFTNEEPSYPSFAYGDIIGRQVFVGLRVKI
jgi:iron complex outermembrane recepter protein